MKSSVGIVFLLLLLHLLISSCDSLKKPGSRGKIPEVRDEVPNGGADAVYSMFIHTAIPDTLACGTEYYITVKANDIFIECENYNYGYLYLEARRLANARINELTCNLTACPFVHSNIVFHSGKCVNGFAQVELRVVVHCPRPNELPADGLEELVTPRMDTAFLDSLPVPFEVRPHEDLFLQIKSDQAGKPCPKEYIYRINLIDDVISCQTVGNYGPYLERARNEATKIWLATRCGPDCSRRPWEELGASWTCEQNNVKIEYWFIVPCKK